MINSVRFSCSLAALSALALVLAPLPSSAIPGSVSSSQFQGSPEVALSAQKKRRGGGGQMQQMQMIQQFVPQEYQGYLQQGGVGGIGGAAGSGTTSPPGDVMNGAARPPGMGGGTNGLSRSGLRMP
jgi:hypothetical protein